MSLFTDTFYESFSSAANYPKQRQHSRRATSSRTASAVPVFSEMEVLQITGSQSELERFNVAIIKLKRAHDLGIRVSLVRPTSRQQHNERKKQRRSRRSSKKEEDDIDEFLNSIFPEKIPFIHDLLMMGSPEVQIVRVDGSHDSIQFFNFYISKLIRDKNMQVTVTVKERKALAVDSIVQNGLDQLEDTLGQLFSIDLRRSMPAVHNMIVGSA